MHVIKYTKTALKRTLSYKTTKLGSSPVGIPYMNCHYKDKASSRPSNLYNGSPFSLNPGFHIETLLRAHYIMHIWMAYVNKYVCPRSSSAAPAAYFTWQRNLGCVIQNLLLHRPYVTSQDIANFEVKTSTMTAILSTMKVRNLSIYLVIKPVCAKYH